MNASKKENEEFNKQKQEVAAQIEQIKQSFTFLSNKNAIYEAKIEDLHQQCVKINNRKEYFIGQSDEHNQDSLKKSNHFSTTTATFMAPRNTDLENSQNSQSNSNSNGKVHIAGDQFCSQTQLSNNSNYRNSSRSSKSMALDSHSENHPTQRSFDTAGNCSRRTAKRK